MGGSLSSRLSVNWARCEGHGLCAHLLPELITLDDNGFPSFPDSPVPAWLEPAAQRAVGACPALALRVNPGGPASPRTRTARRAARR